MLHISKCDHNFCEKINIFSREINVFTNEVAKELISRNIFSVRENLSFSSVRKVVKITITVFKEKSTFFPSNQRFYKKVNFTEILSVLQYVSTLCCENNFRRNIILDFTKNGN